MGTCPRSGGFFPDKWGRLRFGHPNPNSPERGLFCLRLTLLAYNITVIQVYAPTSNAEEAEVERFYEDLQDLLELTPKKDVLFYYR